MDTNINPVNSAIEATPSSAARRPVYHLHIDDSGTRHLDRLATSANEHPKWFALGGILVAEENESQCRTDHTAFYAAWPMMNGPLHITDMRACRKDFTWLNKLSGPERERFWVEYHEFLSRIPVMGTACVIHRPGYLARGYGSRAGDAKWNLCRTAFNIVVERAAKVARLHGRRLRVKYEGANAVTDQAIRGYFALLKNQHGLGFSPVTSAKYQPLQPGELAETLIDLERKDKRSKLMQIADSYVYALARGRYEPGLPLYKALSNAGRLVSTQVEAELVPTLGEKYYCFEGI